LQTALRTAPQPHPAPYRKSLQQLQEAASQRRQLAPTLQQGKTIWEQVRRIYRPAPTRILGLNQTSKSNSLTGQKIPIPAQEQGLATAHSKTEVVASWYGKEHHGRPMANGAPFDMYGATIAHRDIPLGTQVELENPATGEKVKAVVADRGPGIAGRDVDLSYGLAQRLSLVRQGVGNLKMRVL
jgi:rare lipoprotein A